MEHLQNRTVFIDAGQIFAAVKFNRDSHAGNGL